MGVFKNDVGRPSNETIRKRNILKAVCVILVLIIIGLVCYILNYKGIINIITSSKNEEKKKNIITTTNKDEQKEEVLDVNKIKIIDNNKLYYNNEKVNLDMLELSNEDYPDYDILQINNIKQFNNLVLFNVYYSDFSALVSMNSKLEIVSIFVPNGIVDYFDKSTNLLELSLSGYGKTISSDNATDFYDINGDEITIYSNDVANEICKICGVKDNDAMIYSDMYVYKNGAFKKEKSKLLMNAKEYKKNYNISKEDCNGSCN